MIVEILGKFYDNHSLSIVNRNVAIGLDNLGLNVFITPLDAFSPSAGIPKEDVKILKKLASKDLSLIHI